MSASPAASEAVLFFGDEGAGVHKSMLYTDFESIVDHMVGIPDYAGKTIKGAYCGVDGQLNVVAAVLFLLDFNEDGMADRAWNIPLRHLAARVVWLALRSSYNGPNG